MLYARVYLNNDAWEYHILRRYEDRDGGQNLAVRVERLQNPDAFCEWRLPDVICDKSFGFSEQELLDINEYLRDNESIMWDDYREAVAKDARRIK